jgi:acylphosphatase
MSKRRVHLRIRGLVQGVSFRASARSEAVRLRLTGSVKNLLDGDVEAVAEGDPTDVERFVQWCHRGPSEAVVESVTVAECPATGEYSAFQVIR